MSQQKKRPSKAAGKTPEPSPPRNVKPGAPGVGIFNETRLIWALLAAAFGLRCVSIMAGESILWPDEIGQTVEPAHRLVFGYGMVSWEWREGVRSFLFPGFLALFMLPFKLLDVSGSTPYIVAIRLVLSLLSMLPVWYAYKIGKLKAGLTGGLVAAILCGFWYELLLFAPKALWECAAAYLVLPLVYSALVAAEKSDRKMALVAGLLMGLVFALRIQYGVLLPVALGWMVLARRGSCSRVVVPFLAAFLIILLSAGILDWCTWGKPFFSYYSYGLRNARYVYQNIAQGKAGDYGELSWWAYGELLWGNLGIMLPLFIALAAAAWKKNGLLLLSAAAILLLHSLVGHKEYRFIFAVLPLLFTAAGIGIGSLRPDSSKPGIRAIAFVCVTVCLCGAGYFLSQDYSFARQGYYRNEWREKLPIVSYTAPALRAYRFLSSQPDVWGVQDFSTHWAYSGGYFYLHKNVPWYHDFGKFSHNMIYMRSRMAANYFLTSRPVNPAGATLIKTFDMIHVYKKDFVPNRVCDPGYSMNR